MKLKNMSGNLKEIPLPLWVLFFNSFTMAFGFFMLVPLLAVYLLEHLVLSAILVGVIVGVRSFSQQGFMLLGGVVSDRIGYKSIICSGVLIRAFGFLLFGVAEAPMLLFIAAILSGLGGALFHPSSYAYYTVLSTKENRATVYATREMLSNVGFIFGPVVGAFLLNIDFQWVSLSAGLMFIIVFIVSAKVLPKQSAVDRPTPIIKNIVNIVGNPPYVTFCFSMMFVWFLIAQLYIAVPVKLQMLGLPGVNIGLIYSSGAIIIVFLQIPIIKQMSKRFSAVTIIMIGTVCITIGLMIIGFSMNLLGIYLGVIVFTIGQMFIQPMMSKQISDLAPVKLIASYFGFNGLALALGGLIGNVLGGFLYELGLNGFSYLPWLIFGTVGLFVTCFLIEIEKRKRKQKNSDKNKTFFQV
ncbi:MDR family MFS transporter [Halalkalibacter okhensis]|uniref:Major facilitator superfamily (MFS) profile domain-containing protein n=1 Tax=Halalkalibacter okhensis TaxID=333138 RepID=A0A0B0IFH5_9BACI|nr:MFS transporter [Halalkalibacter okhensis]KHF41323.1 hypothetical protein LQ50_03550 [Halalkalibacter okhensis]